MVGDSARFIVRSAPQRVAADASARRPATLTDTTHTAAVVAGDRVSISIVKTAGVAAGQTGVFGSIELA